MGVMSRVASSAWTRFFTRVRSRTRKGREVLQGLRIDAVSQLLPVLAVLDQQIQAVSALIDRTAMGGMPCG